MAAYGKLLDELPAMAVDNLDLHLDTIKHGATGDEIVKYMRSLKEFPGVLTSYLFSTTDHRGSSPGLLIGACGLIIGIIVHISELLQCATWPIN